MRWIERLSLRNEVMDDKTKIMVLIIRADILQKEI